MCEDNCWVRAPKAANTEATNQSQNHSPSSSVAMSVHCCLHWCSHRHLAVCTGARTLHLSRHLALVFAPCVLPLQLVGWIFCLPLSLEQFAFYHDRTVYHDRTASAPHVPTCYPELRHGRHLLREPRLGTAYRAGHRQTLVLQQADSNIPVRVSQRRSCNETCDFV